MAVNRIEKVIEDFLKRPDVVVINAADDYYEEILARIRADKGEEKEE